MDFSGDNSRDSSRNRLPRPAATIILVRDYDHGLQTYLLKRSGKSRFFPGSYVFPGGAVDEDDRDFDFWMDHIDLDLNGIKRRFAGEDITGEDALAYCAAGIREAFEEAGVLMARGGSLQSLERTYSDRINNGLEAGWLRRLVSFSGWTLNLAALFRWSHWITPAMMRYHFDARFFIAAMPESQLCMPDMRETVAGIWISPGDALASNLEGTIPLSPPTIVTMHELLKYRDVELLKGELETRPWGDARLPRMVQSKCGPVIIEPWDPQYGDAPEEMDSTGFESLVHSGCEPFSRIWLHDGVWKPIRAA